MELYVTRHGLTEYNSLGRACGGQTDIPLTEAGKQQAMALGVRLQDTPIDQVLVFPMIRARQTAELVVGQRCIPIKVEPRLQEVKFGIYEGVPIDDPEFSTLRWNFAYRLPGGESLMDVAARLFPFLAELPRSYPHQTVLLVCHGSLARIINAYYTSPTNEEFRSFWMENCDLLHYSL